MCYTQNKNIIVSLLPNFPRTSSNLLQCKSHRHNDDSNLAGLPQQVWLSLLMGSKTEQINGSICGWPDHWCCLLCSPLPWWRMTLLCGWHWCKAWTRDVWCCAQKTRSSALPLTSQQLTLPEHTCPVQNYITWTHSLTKQRLWEKRRVERHPTDSPDGCQPMH